MIKTFAPLLEHREILVAGLLVSVLLLGWAAKRVRKIAKSDRPDDVLANVAMISGFGWSSEAVWLLTGPTGADLVTPIRIGLFAIFETVLVVFMIRAKRNVRTLGHPGRAGRNAWLVAAGMSLVAVWTAHNPGEAFLRLLVPILLTAMWWDGLVGEGVRGLAGSSSWRWTPRRLLLWVGAIEPGERDVETVHRERLIQTMTRLEFKRRHGSGRSAKRRADRLARLSLTADDSVIDAVRERVDRALWFDAKQQEQPPAASPAGVPAREAASRKARRVLHRRSLRTVRVTHPKPLIIAAQPVSEDARTTQEKHEAARFIKKAEPALSQGQIARLLATSPATVGRALRSAKTNGNVPDLVGASNEKGN